MNRIKTLIILGPADGLKSLIVLEMLHDFGFMEGRRVVFACETSPGKARAYCIRMGIPVCTVADPNLREDQDLEALARLHADALVCCGWPHMVSSKALRLFTFPCLNCHGALLPDYRGNRAYLHMWANLEPYYGATIHYLTKRFDDGNLITQARLKLFYSETPRQIHRRIAEVTAMMLPHALTLVENGFPGRRQVGCARYYTPISPWRAKMHRWVNRAIVAAGWPRRLTPHREWWLDRS